MAAVGVDVGGTFTDVVCVSEDGRLETLKVPTTRPDPLLGVREGIRRIVARMGLNPAGIERVIYGTTVATNAILERKGARVGLLMTEGFEDTLEIGRQRRSNMYDLFIEAETPVFVAPRRQRVGIRERIASDGSVLLPLNEQDVVEAVQRLRKEFGIEAIAVCYLFSFLNRTHEERTREVVRRECPELDVSLSCEVDPTFREYERCCVTAFDAYLKPVFRGHIGQLASKLKEDGIVSTVHVMQSRGALTRAETAADRPVTMILSGPAAGVVAACHVGSRLGMTNLISMDMGGTSCDVALIQNGTPRIAREGRIDRYTLRVPMVDITTIGAGGGSIAWIDDAGGLRVGPESAGSDPGPACYGRGNTRATVTDASVVLGYLNPDRFAGGALKLDRDAAYRAVASLARRLNISVDAMAAGIHRIANAKMADAIRVVSVKRGLDPRQFTLVAFGGAGPMHACAVAEEIGISQALVPERPGVLSAYGLLVSDIEHEHAITFRRPASESTVEQLRQVYADLERQGLAKMARDGVAPSAVEVIRLADMRYAGQSYELTIRVPEEVFGNEADQRDALKAVVTAFCEEHERIYGHASREEEVEFVNLRVVHRFRLRTLVPEAPEERPWVPEAVGVAAPERHRPVLIDGERRQVPVYQRSQLRAGHLVAGPAIIEQADCTTIVGARFVCRVCPSGDLILTRRSSR